MPLLDRLFEPPFEVFPVPVRSAAHHRHDDPPAAVHTEERRNDERGEDGNTGEEEYKSQCHEHCVVAGKTAEPRNIVVDGDVVIAELPIAYDGTFRFGKLDGAIDKKLCSSEYRNRLAVVDGDPHGVPPCAEFSRDVQGESTRE